MTNADWAAAQKRLDDYYGRWWRFAPTSHAARVKAAPEIARGALGDDPLLGPFIPNAAAFEFLADSAAREFFTLGATPCLAAVRLWTLEHGGPPPDLAAAVKAAGYPVVPRDPCVDAPLKLAFIAGFPVIYSVGGDLKDDGGRVDAHFHPRRAGDWLLRLAPEPPGR